jgi:secreted Zn-dependent insulinase-like peptidase
MVLKNEVLSQFCYFQYIDMLREMGPKKWYWEEMRDIHAISYRFKENTEAASLLPEYSSKMLVSTKTRRKRRR